VARGARLRHAQAASGRLWQTAPVAAAICAVLAAGVRWGAWPLMLPVVAGAVALAGLAISIYLSRRDGAITDATAAGLDAAAAFGGELRSASWFAARDTHGDWVDYHVARAADRLEAVDWTRLYPPVAAHRAKAATALLAIAAIVLVLPAAGRSGLHATGTKVDDSARTRALDAANLPPELRKQLEAILKQAEDSALANGGKALTEAEVRDLLARLTESLDLKKNAKDRNRLGDSSAKQMEMSSKDLQALAERAKKASELASLSPEVRDALSDVADKLSETSEAQPSGPKDPSEAQATAEAKTGDAAQSTKGGDKQEASVQSVKDASAGGGVGVVMMSSDDPSGAQEAGLGLGGGSSDRNGGGKMPDIAAALRKETIEAYKDDEGEKSKDLRRKTEHGTASVAYAATSPAAFDKGRAIAPPAVPENRRAAVQTYFIRKP
jgi:hypothetical protein